MRATGTHKIQSMCRSSVACLIIRPTIENNGGLIVRLSYLAQPCTCNMGIVDFCFLFERRPSCLLTVLSYQARYKVRIVLDKPRIECPRVSGYSSISIDIPVHLVKPSSAALLEHSHPTPPPIAATRVGALGESSPGGPEARQGQRLHRVYLQAEGAQGPRAAWG